MHVMKRRGSETYPTAATAHGSSGIVPLSRQRFIDGDTTNLGQGSISAPFKTITAFLASRTNASVADASANYVGWLMPCLTGYIESPLAPAPYCSTELRGDSASLLGGTAVIGNIVWANVAGAHAATVASFSMHNIALTGNVTVTDDVGAPVSLLNISGDEAGNNAIITGDITANTTVKLGAIAISKGQVQGSILAGTANDSAALILQQAQVDQTITAKSLQAFDSIFNATVITLNDTAGFLGCKFTAGATLTAPNGAVFDGNSWQSFRSLGGTRSAGTSALVTGGYNGGDMPGAALTAASTDVSLNGAGATAGFTGGNSGNHYTTSNGTPTTVNLKAGGATEGDTLLITKTDLGANAVAVKNVAAATIGTIPPNGRGFVLAVFTGGDWAFEAGGSLAA